MFTQYRKHRDVDIEKAFWTWHTSTWLFEGDVAQLVERRTSSVAVQSPCRGRAFSEVIYHLASFNLRSDGFYMDWTGKC